MSLAELLPKLQELSRADRLRIIEILAAGLFKEEDAARQNPSFSSASLYNSFEAAHQLATLLEKNKEADNA